LHVLVGLGNQGSTYASTRHNIGWNVVARAASQWSIALTPSSTAFLGQGSLEGEPLVLALPLTWMNISGEVVEPLVRTFDIRSDQLIVVHDDLDLPFGRLRVKFGGGTGGHNGLRSIIQDLNTEMFYRLKVGIGRPEPGQETADYVLAPFRDSELTDMNSLMDRSVEALRCLVLEGGTATMNRVNQRVPE
jgi:peptidyl-tRNA hydrolase, PTH1 family